MISRSSRFLTRRYRTVSGAECIERIQREIQAIELNMLSENPTDEERNVRSLLKYRRRLRPGKIVVVQSILTFN